jgi:hypothetical protein
MARLRAPLLSLLTPLRVQPSFPRLAPRAPFTTDAESHRSDSEPDVGAESEGEAEPISEALPGFQPRGPRQPLTFGDRLKVGRTVPYRVRATCSSNNTHLVLSLLPSADEPTGSAPPAEVVAWTSGGSVGFKKAQRGGYEAATQAALRMWEIVDDLRQGKLKQGKGRRCADMDYKRVSTRLQGPAC